jgi:chlorite dismutase
MADTIEEIEETAADQLAVGIGRWLTPAISMVGLTRPSQYVKRPSRQEQSLFEGERSRYLVVYPFVKSTEWYLSPAEERQEVMRGHMRVGHRYPQVRQLLAYSFGLDDQEFIVAYETDDLVAFQDLVRELRETESRRATVRDTPIITGVHRPLGTIMGLLSGPDR